MLKIGVGFRVPAHRLLLLGSLILLPALARADDMSFSGDSSCSDPPIFSDIFSLPATNATGGLCRAFGNHTGHNIDSLNFTTMYPAVNPDFFCNSGPWFLNCDFNVDGMVFHSGDTPPSTGRMITIEFFGLNSDHRGIPNDTVTDPTDPAYYNFFINLNSRVCNPLSTNCVLVQPTGTAAAGDWGGGVVIGGAANVPEPRTGFLVLSGLGVLIARMRAARSERR